MDKDEKKERGPETGKLWGLNITAYAAQAVVLHQGTSAAPFSEPNIPPVPLIGKLQTENANIP